MAQKLNSDNRKTRAGRVMDEAIELAIEGQSPYPERAAFVDAGNPSAGGAIRRAADEGRAVVLVAEDGTTRVLRAEAARR